MSLNKVHTLQAGETAEKVARKYKLTLEELLTANQQVGPTQALQVGQPLNIPTPAGAAVAAAALLAGPRLEAFGIMRYDGIHPAPGTVSTNRASLIYPPLTGTATNRSAELLEQVISQLAVGHNPRYLPGNGFTYCNIFVWDVTRALDCPIPHWITSSGTIAAPGAPGAFEININGGCDWMVKYGVPDHGWRKIDAATAQAYANQGKVAVALWKNPTHGHGHTAMVRPGTLTARGPATAQAGSTNFNDGHLADGFGNLRPLLYGHD